MIKTSFHGNTKMQLELKSFGGVSSDDLMVNVYLFGETDPRLELPISAEDGETVEQAARRALKEFGDMLSHAAYRDQIDMDELRSDLEGAS